ncbi:hypothetical protein SISSUDRAFT_434715 [Sistotremastrum suecicum HHB10207 ss-3]|uniref:Uncharacterized protein n=1 Tax=Sistotremastrum suecicum HHB10207 ss-3 TaxID=1314776 RepID=A0A165YG28_9AGAM|nr:hypothetical protein SISSUDRAFT_434715 [Sistotremastrum suecicum HHB10207 ss-3]
MTGLLYQLRNLAGSFDQDAPRLLNTWKVGLSLSSVILAVVVATTSHALTYEASPFGGPLSNLLITVPVIMGRMMAAIAQNVTRTLKPSITWLYSRGMSTRVLYIVIMAIRVITAPLRLPSFALNKLEWRVKVDQDDQARLVSAYMELIVEASDPKLLERAAASFSYVEWLERGGQGPESVDQLKKAWNRLTATDTSVRVHETLRVRIPPFIRYCAEMREEFSEDIMQSIIRTYPFSIRFPAEVLCASFGNGNFDLRPLATLPLGECLARVLCSYNQPGELGDRIRIFALAEKHCVDLLKERKENDVTRILSHVNQLDIIKSIIQHPHGFYSDIVSFIVKDRKHEFLAGINEFVKEVDQSKLHPVSLSRVFLVLASPPPTDIDLSPLINYLVRRRTYLIRRVTSETIISKTIISYLNTFGVSRISDSDAARQFLRICLEPNLRDIYALDLWELDNTEDVNRMRREAQTLLDTLDGRTTTPLPPAEDHHPASDSNTRYSRALSQTLSLPSSRPPSRTPLSSIL